MTRVAMTCTSGELGRRATAIIGSAETSDLPRRTPFSISPFAPTGLIKSNAWTVRCPSEMFAFDLLQWPEEKVWHWLSAKASPYGVVAVPFKQVLAFGTLDSIRAAFNGCISGAIQRVPISERDFRYEDGAVLSLLQQALVAAIAGKLGLKSDGKRQLWEADVRNTETQNGKDFAVHRSMGIGFRPIGERVYVTVDPTFHVPDATEEDKADIDNLLKRLLGYQHNQDFNEALEYWRKLLCPQGVDAAYDFPPSSAAFEFTISAKPAYAAISMARQRSITLPDSVQALVHHRGIVCEEPQLLFGVASNGRPSVDSMPIRGLATKGPFDNVLSATPSGDQIRVSVICPRAEAALLEAFLAGASRPSQPQRQDKEEYLLPFPGFEQAFRVRLEVPKRTDSNWFTLPEIDPSHDQQTGSRELARNIKDAVQAAAAAHRSVVLVMTPTRWDKWRGFESDDEAFDVHDFVKAYAVKGKQDINFMMCNTRKWEQRSNNR